MDLKQRTLRPLIALWILVIAAALYSISTWDHNSSYTNLPKQKRSSQLIDQNHQVEDIQASPQSGSLNGGSSSASLQNTGAVSDQPVSSEDLYPKDPCGPQKYDNTNKMVDCERP